MQQRLIELRRDRRIATEMEVTYFSVDGDRGGHEIQRKTGMVTSIGRGGIAMAIAHPYHLGAALTLEGIAGDQSRRNGRVCWIRRQGDRYLVGVSFQQSLPL